MTFYSLTFLLLFLPASLTLYYLTPNKLKNTVLLLLSLVFYTLLEPHNIFLLLACLFFDYFMASLVRYYRDKPGIMLLGTALSVVKTVGICLFCLLRANITGASMPVGVLIYTLSATGYVVDLYRCAGEYEKNFLNFALYNCFFGRIFIGPYVKFSLIRPQLRKKRLSLSSITTGMILVIQGIAKRVILGENLMLTYQKLNELSLSVEYNTSVLALWGAILCFSMGLVFILGSYCDIARGLGQLFSFKMPRSVQFPLQALSVGNFLESFHATLYEYLCRYVYRPLGANHHGVLADILNTLLTLMLFGAWFSLSPNSILFGGLLAVFLLGERYFYGRWLERASRFFGHVYTALVLIVAFSVLSAGSLHGAYLQLRGMFFLSDLPLWNNQAAYIVSQGWWVVLLGLLFGFGFVAKAAWLFKDKFPVLANISSVALNLAILFLSVAFIL